jgi:hypothetical protein
MPSSPTHVKKRLITTFALVGLFVAVVLAAIRIYMLRHAPEYDDVLYGGWFDTVTLVLWPSALYLSILMEKEPAKVVVTVLGIAIAFNPLIYAAGGWLIWRIAKLADLDME